MHEGENLLLIDSDAFVLLGLAGLLFDAIDCLGFEITQARRLHPLPYLIRGVRFRQKYPEDLREALLRLCDEIRPLTDRPSESDDLLQRLATVEGIDDGEAQLFARMTEHAGHYLVTGDKRSIIRLAESKDLYSIYQSLCGRVVCLEIVLKRLIEDRGVRYVATAVTPLRSYNKTLSAVFSRGEETPVADCLSGLSSYIADLEEKVGPKFLLR